VPGNTITPNSDLNKCISICFDDVCISKFSVDAVVNSTNESYSAESGGEKLDKFSSTKANYFETR
jgi:hypothetical protein